MHLHPAYGEYGSPYSILARVYDLQHNTYVPDIPMYVQLARQFCGTPLVDEAKPILEIGCGTGRVLLPLVQAGYAITGIDNTREMLSIAETRIRELAFTSRATPSVTLLEADSREINLDPNFGLAFIALNTFLHNLRLEDQLATLRSAQRHLLPGGAIVVDLPPNDELANQPDDGVYEFEATMIDPNTQSRIDKYVASRVYWASQEQELSYRMVEGEHIEVAHFRLRHVFKHEMDLLLLQAGFQTATWYGDYDFAPYAEGSPRMICVARRAG